MTNHPTNSDHKNTGNHTDGNNTDNNWTVRRILDWTVEHLQKHGSESPRLDAEILLAHARNCERISLYTKFTEPVTPAERNVMRELVKRRANAEPVAYLVGHREFFSLDFRVTPDVLIPRPDTETLVVELLEQAKRFAPSTATATATQNPLRILDIGTGSGCIAITAAAQLPHATVTATDLSKTALNIAIENAQKHNVTNRVTFQHGDLFSAIPDASPFEIIVSNPPYIGDNELPTLPDDVKNHEPHSALFAGADGLDIVRKLIATAPQHLIPGGCLLLEIACEQAETVQHLFAANGSYEEITIVNDTTHRPRVLHAKKRVAE